MHRALVVAFVALLAGCPAGVGTSRPAADGVRALVAALRSESPRDAYDLMSASARKKISYDEFALQWKQTGPERAWQAKVLEESLKGDPDVGERAQVGFGGQRVQLEREGKAWRLDSALISRSRATKSREALKLFAEAIKRRDVAAVLGVLTTRRREGLSRQIEGFLTGLEKHVHTGRIDESGTDRAVLRWDEAGIRYQIILRKEEDEWRVDDIVIRATTDDGEPTEGDVDGVDREID
jgi:hypothetical protein